MGFDSLGVAECNLLTSEESNVSAEISAFTLPPSEEIMIEL